MLKSIERQDSPETTKIAEAVKCPLLSRREAAAYLGLSEQTLAIWKVTGRYSLPVYKIGKLAKYKKSDLDAFIASRVHVG